jgi:hypothetical protein
MNSNYVSPAGGQLWKPGAQAPSIIGGRSFTPAASYPSSSDPKKRYTVCEVSDGSVSCDCSGWTKRNPPGGRTCKHTQDYVRYLRPLWNKQPVGGTQPVSEAQEVAPRARAGGDTKGGTLDQLFRKLDKETEQS